MFSLSVTSLLFPYAAYVLYILFMYIVHIEFMWYAKLRTKTIFYASTIFAYFKKKNVSEKISSYENLFSHFLFCLATIFKYHNHTIIIINMKSDFWITEVLHDLHFKIINSFYDLKWNSLFSSECIPCSVPYIFVFFLIYERFSSFYNWETLENKIKHM